MAFVNYKPAQPLPLRREISLKSQLQHKKLLKKEQTLESFQQFKKSAKRLVLEFGKKSTIHSVSWIFQDHSNKFERFFWLLTFTFALLSSIYVCIILSQRFNEANRQTVVHSTNKPVFEVYFPEVVICNKNHLNWDRISEAKAHFMPNETNAERIRIFELVIGLYDDIQFGNFKVFNALKGQPISLVNNINFSLVYEFMTWRCEELLTDCSWRYHNVNCCDVFLKSRGLNGLCWHFNTLSTHEGRQRQLMDSKYPWRTGGSGQKSGLSLRVMINEEKHYRKNNHKGLWVSVMEPNVFFKDIYSVPANTETLVVVEPVIYFYDNNTRRLPSTVRRCLFADERNNNIFKNLANFTYMIENCEVQCRQEYLLSYCNCTMDLLFPQAGYRSCNVEDLLCVAKYNSYLRFFDQKGEENYVSVGYRGMICKCYRNCYSLNYLPDVKPLYMPLQLRSNKTCVDLDVHFRFPKMMMYRTSLVFGWVDLLVAFGGIAGLFLGCSLISGIELFYFVFIQLPLFMLSELKAKAKRKEEFEIQHNINEFQFNELPRKRCNWVMNNRLRIAQDLQKYDFPLYENNTNCKHDAQQYFLINKQKF